MEIEQSKRIEIMLPNNSAPLKIKAYKKRWFILGIFIYNASINSLQWLEYSSITNLAVKYYNVHTMAVDWSSTVYFAMYPLLVIPVSYLIEMQGLRLAGLIGCIGNLVAVTVKVLSIHNDRFWVVMLGQIIGAVSQLFIVCLPTKIASVWFKENEISTACSLGVSGTLLGYALGFILPTLLVHDSNNLDDIGEGLKTLCWTLVGIMIPVTVATITYFPKEPKNPPNKVQATLRENNKKFQSKYFFNSIKKLFKSKAFMIHLVAYSINVAGINAVVIFLNQFTLQYFPGADEDVGWMGFVLIVIGMFGSVIFGILLDKTHKYKEINLFIYITTTISIVFLMFSMKYESKVMTYISCAVLGLFSCGYLPVGFEFAMELTYPLEESTTTGIILSSVQLHGVIFVVMLGFLNEVLEAFWSLAVVCVIIGIGNVFLCFVPNQLKRQDAFKKNELTLI
ncbi:unnamed protein product [Psylliodes chrysocephalus]|uniref:Major facilitator superfamily (MFS) profile domain-containing protein n=1 Tax=Psylliodes chrysocephalus TaxID=3402493 RepID=A0A9P0CQQ5_9CUCU|nr:unnamed protein product [Psylliodes chrysocephala]